MAAFSFAHIADIHLGYAQYNLPERREDFSRAFIRAVDQILELKPSFVILAGDIFDDPRPPNVTLATAIRELRRLRTADIPVLATDGSHDTEPNVITGTVLLPLHHAGLLEYLPRLPGAAWKNENCYVYGLRSFRGLRDSKDNLAAYLEQNPPRPSGDRFNVCVFHGALAGLPLTPPFINPDLGVEQLPEGFDYYAGGHIHKFSVQKIKRGLMVYAGPLETTAYTEAAVAKGFCLVEVRGTGVEPIVSRVNISGTRSFKVIHREHTESPSEITRNLVRLVQNNDELGTVIVLVLRGKLPPGTRRGEINILKIKEAASKSLQCIVLNHLSESSATDALRLKEPMELRTLAQDFFLQSLKFREPQLAEKLARVAFDLMEPLLKDDEKAAKALLEELV